MRHLWTVLCSRSILDKSTNQLTLVDVIDDVSLRDAVLPTGEHLTDSLANAVATDGAANITAKMELVSQWARSDMEKPEKGRARFTILSPSGELLGNASEARLDMTKFKYSRHMLRFESFSFVGAGTYLLVVQQKSGRAKKWRTVSETPFTINYGPRAQKEGAD